MSTSSTTKKTPLSAKATQPKEAERMSPSTATSSATVDSARQSLGSRASVGTLGA